jgi:pimeloyl-ACP methyl ester carboxylesterase
VWTADDGTAINYEVHDGGGGETLLLLPGLLGSLEQWRRFLPPLCADFRVVLLDLRGHGHSENASSTLQPERMVQDIAGLLDHLGIGEAHTAGYSLGGYLGLMLHLQEPRRVPTLLMHATKFYWTAEAMAMMRQQLDPDTMVEKAPGYAGRLANEHGGGRWRNLVRQAADLVAGLGASGLTEGMIRHVQAPVLVSVGDCDELVTLPEAQRLSRALPHGQLLVLPGVRHPFGSAPEVPLIPMMKTFHRGNPRYH